MKAKSKVLSAIAEGDIFVKLSMLIMGAGYFRRKQYIRGLIMTLFQVGVIYFLISFSAEPLSKLTTLGTVKAEKVFNFETMQNEFNDYDNSFLILLYSIFSIVVAVTFIIIYLKNIIEVRELELRAKAGKHINTFIEDIKDYKNHKFHKTLLFLPCMGVVLFNIIPLITMICVAFTNYDRGHMPPSELFTWSGFQNFINLFKTGENLYFSYSFVRVLGWTLVWAFVATFTCYFGGILMSMLIMNKKTKAPKVWRTLFIIPMAVPQFVSLLVVRNLFAKTGIVNTLCAQAGITDFLKNIGLVPEYLEYIPFLTEKHWAMVMIILINIWVGIPYQMLIATGVLMNIPKDLMESARIDGATSFQVFRKITMPYMLFVTGPYLVTSVVNNINNFNVIYLLTNDVYSTANQYMANASAQEIDLLVTWLFRLTQTEYNYKMASTIGIVVFVICSLITLFTFNKLIKGDKEGTFQ